MDESFKPKSPVGKIENQEKLKIEWAAETIESEKHSGRNEDAILADPNHRAFGIFDGMGGHSAGDVASKAARDYVLVHLQEIPEGVDIDTAKQALSNIIKGVDKAVREASLGLDMGTTATVLKIHTDTDGKNWALIANVGDSRAYKINKDGTIRQLTIDDDIVSESRHSPEARQKITEKMANARSLQDFTEEEIYYFTLRHEIARALGRRDSLPGIYVVPISKGEQFLLTSDGVHDNLTTLEIEETLGQEGTLKYVVNDLIRRSVDRSREPPEKKKCAPSRTICRRYWLSVCKGIVSSNLTISTFVLICLLSGVYY